MRDGICPKCGSREIYSKIQDLSTFQPNITVFEPLTLETYVCAHCGLLENYVADLDQLKRIPKKWKRVQT